MSAVQNLRPQTVLIAGGGAAAIEAAPELTATGSTRLDIEIIAAEATWSFRPLTVLEPFAGARPRNYAIDALEARGLRIHADSLASVDPDHRTVDLASGTTLHYDALLLATGAELHAALCTGSVSDVAFVVPPETGWSLLLYELTLGVAVSGRRAGRAPRLTVVTAEQAPLDVLGREASRAVSARLRDRGVAGRLAAEQAGVAVVPIAAALEAGAPLAA